jgi:protoheme IX farnesyltransferase
LHGSSLKALAPEAPAAGTGSRTRAVAGRYLELAKARLSTLVVITTLVGYLVAPAPSGGWVRLFWTVIGTGLAAGGANGLNQWRERGLDRLMERTRSRPIPSGRLSPGHALLVALVAAGSGVLLLATLVNLLTAALAALVVLLYVLVYTPLKTRSHANTLVGAVCGAIPPVMGWTAARGVLEPPAFILAALLFAWQIPHFLALAWMYREDYARAGYRMLPLEDPSGRRTAAMVLLYSLALIPISLAASAGGLSGWVYAAGATLLGAGLVALGARLVRERSVSNARRVFLASITYLPLLLGLMVLDRAAPDEGAAAPAPALHAATQLPAPPQLP